MPLDEYFGKLDAEQETIEKINEYFYKKVTFDDLKIQPDTDYGKCVIVGIKGSGKTHICKWLEQDFNKNRIGWKLQLSDGIDVTNDKRNSTYFSVFLQIYLLTKLMKLIEDRKDEFSPTAMNNFPGLFKKLFTKLSSLSQGIKFSIEGGPAKVEIDPSVLFKTEQNKLSQTTIDEYYEILRPCLQEKKGFILVDDVDKIFPGSDTNFDFIEGLVGAIGSINRKFGKLLHIIVFIKAGAFSNFYEHGGDYEKYKDQTYILRWNSNDLVELLAYRSAIVNGKSPQDADVITNLSNSFKGDEGSVREIVSYMTEFCNNGPRDILYLANFAKSIAQENRISKKNVKDSENQYSRDKLFQLNRDYERQYGNVSRIIELAFRNKKIFYSRNELDQFIQTQILGNHIIMDTDLAKANLIVAADSTAVIERLFDFGFIGYKENNKADYKYFMDTEGSLLSPGTKLLHAYYHRVHPAYVSNLLLT